MNRRFWIYVCLGIAVGIGIGVGIGAGIWGEDEEVVSTTAETLTSTATSKTTTASTSTSTTKSSKYPECDTLRCQTLQTHFGTMTGFLSPDYPSVVVFRAIPFATAPVGQNRFKPVGVREHLTEELNALHF